MKKICENCGKEFSTTHSIAKLCSLDCRYATHGKRVKRRIIKQCAYCGKDFETGGQAGNKNQVYCSLRCIGFGRHRTPTINDIPMIDAAYIAGLIDGEGCIGLYDRKQGGRLSLRISITNTDRPVLEYVKNITGIGAIHKRVNIDPVHHKDCYQWQCCSQNGAKFLSMILPYMRIKHDRAVVAIDSQN